MVTDICQPATLTLRGLTGERVTPHNRIGSAEQCLKIE